MDVFFRCARSGSGFSPPLDLGPRVSLLTSVRSKPGSRWPILHWRPAASREFSLGRGRPAGGAGHRNDGPQSRKLLSNALPMASMRPTAVAAAPAEYFDAVLLDMRMPILDGREAARRIRATCLMHVARYPSTPCHRARPNCYAIPGRPGFSTATLTKPLKQSDLLELLRDHECKSSGRQAKSADRRHRDAVLERIKSGMREIDDALARADSVGPATQQNACGSAC